MLSIYTIAAYCIWTVIFVVWMFGRKKNKQTVKRVKDNIYILLYFSYLLLFVPPFFLAQSTYTNPTLSLLGVILCALGAIFAIWSRLVLGKNWSAIAAQKAQHELVQSGPYSIVRHPIYMGFVLAMSGFSLTVGTTLSYTATFFGVISLLLRIPVEEKLLNDVFPNAYKEYSKKQKRIIPYIW